MLCGESVFKSLAETVVEKGESVMRRANSDAIATSNQNTKRQAKKVSTITSKTPENNTTVKYYVLEPIHWLSRPLEASSSRLILGVIIFASL